MMTADFTERPRVVAELVAAYVSNNAVAPADLPSLIVTVSDALNRLATQPSDTAVLEPAVTKPTPAQIKQSIRPEVLISFVDGKPYRTLKRHLTAHGLDPTSYRQRYGLPANYPVVSQSYSARRSDISRGLQSRKRQVEP